MKIKKFSIIEMAVVLFVILLLMSIAATFYRTVQRSLMIKNQQIEFDNIKIAINAYKASIRGAKKGSEKHVNLFDLIHTHALLTEKRIMLVNGNDKVKSNAQVLSYFETPIEIYYTKQKIGATDKDIEDALKIAQPGKEYLTGNFEFYFGRDHEVDGGETADPKGFGLIGTGNAEDANQYFYRFVYYENAAKDSPPHEYLMH